MANFLVFGWNSRSKSNGNGVYKTGRYSSLIQNVYTPLPLLQGKGIFSYPKKVANFSFLGGILSKTVTETVYTKCLYAAPVTTREEHFLLS